ncbi:hypothetical protein MJ579_02350 [Klebsiella pneumoniae]|nr:hypothetical protein MJ579_02350 [Klebsiella pneumoniae]
MQGPALAHGANAARVGPALRGIRQQAVMAAHAVDDPQIAQKRALLTAFQAAPPAARAALIRLSATGAAKINNVVTLLSDR